MTAQHSPPPPPPEARTLALPPLPSPPTSSPSASPQLQLQLQTHPPTHALLPQPCCPAWRHGSLLTAFLLLPLSTLRPEPQPQLVRSLLSSQKPLGDTSLRPGPATCSSLACRAPPTAPSHHVASAGPRQLLDLSSTPAYTVCNSPACLSFFWNVS